MESSSIGHLGSGSHSSGQDLPEEAAPRLCVGQHEAQRHRLDAGEALSLAQAAGYDVITIPITTEDFQSRVLAVVRDHIEDLESTATPNSISLPEISSLTPNDTTLTPAGFNSSLIGVLSPWIDLGSTDPLIAHVSRQVFMMEIAYAAFCGVGNILLHGPIMGSNTVQYARAVLDGLALSPYIQLQILLPMIGELELDGGDSTHLSELAREQYHQLSDEEDEDYSLDPYSSWEVWNSIRTMCNYSSKLGIALEIPRALPLPSLQSRWVSEPIRTIVFPRTSFLRNAKGYPVLSKPHQQLLTRFLRLRFAPWALLGDVEQSSSSKSDSTPDPTPSEAAVKPKEKSKDQHAHLKYLRHLQQTQPPRPPMERFGQGYQDYIQSPLQPLTDNLESITYEVFEKDPIKYEWYERAVAAALQDLHAVLQRSIIVTVAGAGRGPLVTRVLLASQKTGIPVTCCAVEKNPNAYVLIQRRNATDPLWNQQVHVYHSDMRNWPGPRLAGTSHPSKVDILVSELLGSFADNELSPECLDGVQHVLHPEHGVNIPQSYSAHVTPLATPRLFGDLVNRPPGIDTAQWETPVVVMLGQFDYLCVSAQSTNANEPNVQEAWAFSHPVPPALLEPAGGYSGMAGERRNNHNVRNCHLRFRASQRGVCHGLAGYFETVLYAPTSGGAPIELSTNPATMDQKSKDMISWFPIWFPLKTPLDIPDDAEIEVYMWRQTDGRMVWYEWMLEVYTSIPASPDGQETTGKKKPKRARLAGSGLHSSRKNGCLM